ncbi:MAG: SRPBCC family protein [Alphaproteobacteria bacterium]|jgi:carbon monoxide dehydrogenase subunit G
MDLAGEYRIEAPRDAVWQALNDPDVLKQCIPGCQEIEKETDTAFTAKVKSKIGPVSATFKGKVTLSDLDPPNGYTISGEGQGGVAGFAKGGARVTLEEDGTTTMLRYTADGQVGGKLAQVGARLVEGAAKKVADDFFTRFNKLVSEQAAAEPTAATPQAAAESVSEPVEPAPKGPTRAPASPLLENIWFGLACVTLLMLFVMAGLAQ